jgi:hypothetical protein
VELRGTTIVGILVPSSDPLFLSIVGVHVLFGLACVISGMLAMFAAKGRGRHSRFGTIYFWCMSGLFLTMAFLAFIRWADDYVLFLLGALAFGLVSLGRLAVIRRWGLRFHASLMGTSYIVMLTAFYVDNGKNLPIWKDMPPAAYWTIPALVGVPLILWALARHPLLRKNTA